MEAVCGKQNAEMGCTGDGRIKSESTQVALNMTSVKRREVRMSQFYV
jgi:hypothetical protein